MVPHGTLPGAPPQRAARLKAKTRIFAIIVILSNALGNFALTWGMKHQSAPLTFSPLAYISAILSPWVMLGISLLILWLLARMALLSWADLSYVLPVTSLGYVASALIGHFFLGEHVTSWRWMGTLLIVAGTVLVGAGSPHSEYEDSGRDGSAKESGSETLNLTSTGGPQ